MDISIPKSLLVLLKEQFPEDEILNNYLKEIDRYRSYSEEDSTLKIDIEKIDIKYLPILAKLCRESKGVTGSYNLRVQIETFLELQNKIITDVIVKDLKSLATVIESYISPSINHFLFQQREDGNWLPYLVTGVQYHAATSGYGGGRTPAFTQISLSFSIFNEARTDSISFYAHDLIKGSDVKTLLFKQGYILETKELFDDYVKALENVRRERKNVGKQFIGKGLGIEEGGRSWRGSDVSRLQEEGIPDKLIVDIKELKATSYVTNSLFWKNKEKETQTSIPSPEHPYLYVFNLRDHSFYRVHINNLTPYIYNPDLRRKLILPKAHSNLIDILVEGQTNLMEDIITGKTGGIIIAATGEPGTGKTLTAEVYSEVVEKPLYVVQSSQLGVDLESLEGKLKEVLKRAARWKAILLIDEADVYIHQRGNDLHQNAVVGVFLRVLEYYRGILFMTSNRGDIIDDAIMSRATAHIVYTKPGFEEKVAIFGILAEQFKFDIPLQLKEDLANRFPTISGRDIKSLLKLAKLLHQKRNLPIDMGLFEYVAPYLNIKEEQLKRA